MKIGKCIIKLSHLKLRLNYNMSVGKTYQIYFDGDCSLFINFGDNILVVSVMPVVQNWRVKLLWRTNIQCRCKYYSQSYEAASVSCPGKVKVQRSNSC